SGCEPVPGGECGLRPDARLVTVFFTDTGEQTPAKNPRPGGPTNTAPAWAASSATNNPPRPGRTPTQVPGTLSPFRPPAGTPPPCSDGLPDPTLFDRYSEVVSALGGTEGSIRGDQASIGETVGHIVDAAIVGACCGDGVIEPGEQCDDGNTDNGDCCSATCQFEPAGTTCRPAA